MELRGWRKTKGLTLEFAAGIFGLPISTLSELERGIGNLSWEQIVRIEAGTAGAVTVCDLLSGWKRKHPDIYHLRASVGRAVARDALNAAEQSRKEGRKNGTQGKKEKDGKAKSLKITAHPKRARSCKAITARGSR